MQNGPSPQDDLDVNSNRSVSEIVSSAAITFALAVLYAAGMWLLVVHRELKAAHGDWGVALGPILSVALPALGLIAALYGAAALWSKRIATRANTLIKMQPDALVLRSGRVPQLVVALSEGGFGSAFDFRPADFPLGFNLVANTEGIEVWGGSPLAPFEYLMLPWDDVSDVRASETHELGRVSGGLTITARSRADGPWFDLPFVVLGRGFGGLFPQTRTVLQKYAGLVDELKPVAPAEGREEVYLCTPPVIRVIFVTLVSLAGLAPLVSGLYFGLCMFPAEALGSSPRDSYLLIGTGPLPAIVGSTIVAVQLVLILVAIAVVRASRPARWTLDRPYSLWRAVRWASGVYVVAFWVAALPPSLLSIRLGRLVPTFYDGGAPDLSALYGPWSTAAGVCAIVSVTTYAIDKIVMHVRPFTSTPGRLESGAHSATPHGGADA